jgi:16S rRNA (uracil1498-N3)-methyltransferase
MRRRFLADEVHGSTASLTGQNAAHLARVLRARIGQEYEIAANGFVRIGRISSVSDELVEFALGEEVEMRGAPSSSPSFGRKGGEATEITLLAAIFKFDRFEWAVEKATELGVARIVPVIARRTDAHLAQAAAKRVERWRRIAHEASQQSRRIQPPDIADPVKLKEALRSAGVSPAVAQPALSEVEGSSPALGDSDLNILLAESEEDRSVRSVLEDAAETKSISLAVGPEGGWTNDEFQLFAASGWTSASLGSTILRAETAAIAALAIVVAFES